MGHAMSPRVPLVKELMKIGQAHYPMCVDLSFFVNTPIVFQLCWTIIKTVRDHPIISHPLLLRCAALPSSLSFNSIRLAA